MGWAFLWLMVALKIPILAALWIVWWALHAEPETDADVAPSDEGGGGAKVRPHAPPRLPRAPRRGPHGDPAYASPPRVRSVTARGRRSPSQR